MKNINISKQSIMRINIFLAVFLGILSLQVFAQNDLIPADNNDLQQIIDKVKEIKNITRRCADGDCPPIDCETMGSFNRYNSAII